MKIMQRIQLLFEYYMQHVDNHVIESAMRHGNIGPRERQIRQEMEDRAGTIERLQGEISGW